MSENRLITIGLLGPWGGDNLGCTTTQDAMIQNMRSRIPGVKIVGFSINPPATEARHGIPFYDLEINDWSEQPYLQNTIFERISKWLIAHPTPITLKLERLIRRLPLEIVDIIQTIKRLKSIDLLIVSGGGQLEDHFGGAWRQPYWLIKYALLSKLTGTKYMFVCVGAGPINGKLSKIFIKLALSLADYRSYRDLDSKKFVEKVLGFFKEDPVYPDLAYSICIKDFHKKNTQRIVVGVGVMAYYDPYYWPEKDQAIYQTYLNKLASFVSWLVQQNYEVNFLVGEAIADRIILNDLNSILEKAGIFEAATEQVKDNSIQSVDDLFCQIANTDFVVASRFHNVLLSTILHKPVIALSYHPKIDSLMKNSGQSAYCLPIDQFDVEDLKERFLALQANCESIKKQLEEITIKNRIALEEQYEHIFSKLKK